MKTLFTGISLLWVLFIFSCNKNDPTPAPTPMVTAGDTLTSGWTKLVFDKSENFTDIFFNNNTTGFLTGINTYQSNNGGLAWNLIRKEGFMNLALTGNGNAFFLNNDSVYKSSDGFASFTAFGGKLGLQDIFFVDNQDGYLRKNSGLYKTSDGGANWTLLSTPLPFAPAYSPIFFLDTTHGFTVINREIYKTAGSSSNWVAATIAGAKPATDFSFAFAASVDNVYAITKNAQLYKSTDGGISFSLLKSFGNNLRGVYNDIHFVDDNTGWVSADNKIYKTTDGGNIWNVVVTLGDNSILSEIHFTDANHGWACGTNGVVLLYKL